jgi:hypothetical protein
MHIPNTPRRAQVLDALMPTSWLFLLTFVVSVPYILQSPSLGDDLTRRTVRLALLYYAVAVTLMLLLQSGEWQASSIRGRLARWCWTLALATYLVHLTMAFHHYHHWSHADAVAHTEAVSRFGQGIWFSHLFTLLWTADVAAWWTVPNRYARRSPWWDRLLHGYMAFIIFNATFVYEEGPIHWAGMLLFMELGVVLLYRTMVNRPDPRQSQ